MPSPLPRDMPAAQEDRASPAPDPAWSLPSSVNITYLARQSSAVPSLLFNI